jgi:hypothetical protein
MSRPHEKNIENRKRDSSQQEEYEISRQMIRYLDSKVNCSNIERFLDDHYEVKPYHLRIKEVSLPTHLKRDFVDVSYELVEYPDTDETEIVIQNIFNTLKFINEANYAGLDYFPWLYGLLKCNGLTPDTQTPARQIHTFYEYFETNLYDYIPKITNPGVWYEICFQLALISDFMRRNQKSYDASMKNHLIKFYEKPIFVPYTKGDVNLSIRQTMRIVVKDFYLEESTSGQDSSIQSLLKYLSDHPDLKIPPSPKNMSFMHKYIADPTQLTPLLASYYQSR